MLLRVARSIDFYYMLLRGFYLLSQALPIPLGKAREKVPNVGIYSFH